MSANIEQNAYVGRQAAWHGLGTVKGRHFTWAEAEAEGGLDFAVFKSQLRDGLGRPIDAWGTFRWNKADIEASRPEGAIFLGTVGKDYKVLPHGSGFALIDSLMATQTGAHYETAGVLGKGQTVWGLADLNLVSRVGGDETKNYLLFSTGHDGLSSYDLRAVGERVVCQNTLAVALREATRSVFKVRHTAKAADRVAEAHAALANIRLDVRSAEEKLQWLAGHRVTREALTSVLDRLFPKTEKVALETGQQPVLFSSRQRDEKLAEVLAIFESNDGDAFPEQRGTALNLLNAVTNWVDHGRGKSPERAESALFGSGSKLKTQALETILGESASMPYVPIDFNKVFLPATSRR